VVEGAYVFCLDGAADFERKESTQKRLRQKAISRYQHQQSSLNVLSPQTKWGKDDHSIHTPKLWYP
jgi:hypothetical protein